MNRDRLESRARQEMMERQAVQDQTDTTETGARRVSVRSIAHSTEASSSRTAADDRRSISLYKPCISSCNKRFFTLLCLIGAARQTMAFAETIAAENLRKMCVLLLSVHG